jgi:hypothetical protein
MGAGSGPPGGAGIIHNGRMYSRSPFLTERSLFLFRRGTSINILSAVFFLT